MQALNVVRGGSLHQHLPDRTALQHRQRHAPFKPAHPVTVTPGSPLQRITVRRQVKVNSFHHQAVDRLGSGLEVIARAADGTVEALHDPSARFALGVQWHAELLTHRPEHASVLGALISAAGRPALALAVYLATRSRPVSAASSRRQSSGHEHDPPSRAFPLT